MMYYCENGECRVETFNEGEVALRGAEEVSNCPGCGRFGRKKGKQ